MSTFEGISLAIALLALVISLGSLYFSGRANNLNKNMFKRQGIIDLFMAWQGTADIDPAAIIGPDVVKSANALALTASLWNHDVIEKVIIYQTYWEPFQSIYDKLNSLDVIAPGLKKTCKAFLSSDMTRAYEEMKKFEIGTVKTTKI